MKVVYEKPIWEQINYAIDEARTLNETIAHIEVTKLEYNLLAKYVLFVGNYSHPITIGSYGGVALKVVG